MRMFSGASRHRRDNWELSLVDTRNSAGHPLSGSSWLEAHHQAKRAERRAFLQRVVDLQPSRVVDLGCGTGLWLQELDDVLPASCELIGCDHDHAALTEALNRASCWQRKTCFERRDLCDDKHDLPDADVALLFNVSAYIPNLDCLLQRVSRNVRHLLIRQYDGATMRFGPMSTTDRALIDDSLRSSVANSRQFHHFGIDRVHQAIHRSTYANRDIEFEAFSRTSPFPAEFTRYFERMLDWTRACLSPAAAERLELWRTATQSAYFCEVDLVASLS